MESRQRIRIGTSGWAYTPWRGAFYPTDLPRGEELDHLSARMPTAEINASFYSLQRPEHYRRWYAQTPEDFLFAVKGGRFITHLKKLRDPAVPLANFFASGVLALEDKLGPIVWQLPPSLPFDAERIATFLHHLPHATSAAANLAQRHDHRLDARALTSVDTDRPLRHAIEVRHSSFAVPEFIALLREHGVALVIADTAGTWPYLEDVTADFVYVRLHGDTELYASGYTAEALDTWGARVRAWHSGHAPRDAYTVAPADAAPTGRDVYVYFDNDIKAHAPYDALALARRCT